ncbi:MAG TPA: mandelate racemase/muconate lactonizing enzyme family protein [Burkholderiales bacterium]|nr:mandelate racemase/muconate lactonizing enzyme family protein [Burkholderiales bacterium]
MSPRSLRAALEEVVLPLVREVDLSGSAAVDAALARVPENRLAKGMVSTACWTMRAASAAKPLWQLLGGSGEAEVCWTITRRAPGLMAKEAADYCRRYGFRTLKVKGGQGLDVDLQALKEIRAAVGAGVALYVDANSAYSREQALDYVNRIAGAGAMVAEDPCPLAPDASFESLQKQAGIAILVDAACTSVRDAGLFLARGARAISLKPGRVGMGECLSIRNTLSGCKSSVGIYAESALGTLINLQLPAELPAEQTFFLMMPIQVAAAVPQIRDGRIRLPDQPDMSKLIDWKAVRKLSAGAVS